MTSNSLLRIALVIWAVAYPVVSCAPAYLTHGLVLGTIGNLASLTLATVLFVPWAIGLVVLWLLVRVTRRDRIDRR